MRFDGWEQKLRQYLDDSNSTVFEWGVHDCALWAADWVYIGTGNDFGQNWRGRYSTALGAQRLMKQRGFKDAAAIADSHFEPIPVRLARRGDLVLHDEGNLGICNGLRSLFLAQGGGLLACDTLQCVAAWRVD